MRGFFVYQRLAFQVHFYRCFFSENTVRMDSYDEITIKDMIEQGMLEELAGRISISVNFRKLSQDDMRRLIRSKTEQISRERGVRIELTLQAVDALMTVAYTNLGVRAPMNLMTELVFETLANHTLDGTFDRDRDIIVIEGKSKARIKRIGKTSENA